jgi:hypothetical protein
MTEWSRLPVPIAEQGAIPSYVSLALPGIGLMNNVWRFCCNSDQNEDRKADVHYFTTQISRVVSRAGRSRVLGLAAELRRRGIVHASVAWDRWTPSANVTCSKEQVASSLVFWQALDVIRPANPDNCPHPHRSDGDRVHVHPLAPIARARHGDQGTG